MHYEDLERKVLACTTWDEACEVLDQYWWFLDQHGSVNVLKDNIAFLILRAPVSTERRDELIDLFGVANEAEKLTASWKREA